MMLLPFASKKALAAHVAERIAHGRPVYAARVVVETSIFGPELRADGTFAVCLNHPARSRFAEIVVRDGCIVAVK